MKTEYYLSLLKESQEEIRVMADDKRKETYANVITFSRNVFVPVTHQCRNRCAYCGFVSDDPGSWIAIENYRKLLDQAKNLFCSEVLITLGEKPEEKYPSARHFLEKQGFDSTVDYVNHLCEIALNKKLLPHSNLGVLSYEELAKLKDSNVSLGLMLESSSSRLMEKGEAHYYSPGKDPSLRISTIENAGKLKIPFTTGILIGIGETWEERAESLIVLAQINEKYNHIQEIIIQNFNPQLNTPMSNFLPPTDDDILLTVALARVLFPPEVSIQIPPNLNKDRIYDVIFHGANDFGGISPLTIDYINPNMDWQQEKDLQKELHTRDYILRERLPVYPKYEKYLSTRIREIIEEHYRNERTFTP